MFKLLTDNIEDSALKWWEKRRLFFTLIGVAVAIIIAGVQAIFDPAKVNAFFWMLLGLQVLFANILYFTGYITEFFLRKSGIKIRPRDVSIFLFILLCLGNIISVIILFIYPEL